MYENHICELRSEELNEGTDHRTFAVANRKPEENSGLYGIRTLDLCDTGEAL